MHLTINSVGTWRKEIISLTRNIHFWIILALTIAIVTLYYVNGFKDYIHWFWRFRVFEFTYRINGSLLYLPFVYAILAFGLSGILSAWIFSLIIICSFFAL